jgi:UDP-N-acetylmuramyl pentapeptide phosphotransferase/UDP-N-acetylglucosamine-1-phosphate transferase
MIAVLFLVPIFITGVTNTVNQLGGLNGLEATSGIILLIGLEVANRDFVLLTPPLIILLILAYVSFTGKAFLGNTGSFAIGLTASVYAILFSLKLMLIIALAPFILNSLLILFSRFFLNSLPTTSMDENGRLSSDKIRSLRSLILKIKPMKEREAVAVTCGIIAIFVALAVILKTSAF